MHQEKAHALASFLMEGSIAVTLPCLVVMLLCPATAFADIAPTPSPAPFAANDMMGIFLIAGIASFVVLASIGALIAIIVIMSKRK